MINVNMTDKAGVTLATAGKYCADNVKVTPSAEILRKDEQAKTATPTTSAQDITPDAGKALSKVTVNPITADIVGNLDASSFAASIVAAVEGKGVTVPDGTLLDGMAALIESIQTGGGGSCNIVSGTISWAAIPGSIISTEFEHNLGRIPKLFLIYPAFDITSSIDKSVGVFFLSTENIGSFARNTKNETLRLYNNMPYSLLQSPISASGDLGVYADETKLLFNTYLDSVFTVTAGDLYNWIIVG